MVNRSKIIGTGAEVAVVKYLRDNGFAQAERRALAGIHDQGDVAGTPGLVWEVKARRTLALPAWLRETEKERARAKADFGILVVKPAGYGVTRVGRWWAVMRAEQWSKLLAAITALGAHMPLSHPTELSGARIIDLRDTVRRLPEPRYTHRMSLPHVLINPKGIKDPMRYYCVTTVDQVLVMVRLAGYGNPLSI